MASDFPTCLHGYPMCPYDDVIMDYLGNWYEAVFILLHPFIKPVRINKSRLTPEFWPQKGEMVATCDPVRWKQILAITPLASLAQIDVGLRTRILGLHKERRNKTFADILEGMERGYSILCPSEGDLSELLQNRLYEVLEEMGHEQLWHLDEFGCEEPELLSIQELMKDDCLHPHARLFSVDKRVLIATHWDSHCSFICSSRDTIEKLLVIENFEGFFVSEQTHVYWSLHDI